MSRLGRHVAAGDVTALCDPDQDALDQVQAFYPRAERYQGYGDFLHRA